MTKDAFHRGCATGFQLHLGILLRLRRRHFISASCVLFTTDEHNLPSLYSPIKDPKSPTQKSRDRKHRASSTTQRRGPSIISLSVFSRCFGTWNVRMNRLCNFLVFFLFFYFFVAYLFPLSSIRGFRVLEGAMMLSQLLIKGIGRLQTLSCISDPVARLPKIHPLT